MEGRQHVASNNATSALTCVCNSTVVFNEVTLTGFRIKKGEKAITLSESFIGNWMILFSRSKEKVSHTFTQVSLMVPFCFVFLI